MHHQASLFGSHFDRNQPPKRHRMETQRMKTRFAPWLVAGLCMSLLSACSKTVTWQEEVPLNTGEVIWVERTVTYKLQGAGGNPLDMAYRPDWTETRSFTWQGKKYSYTGDAGLMLLAISPINNTPVLVAQADRRNWSRKNGYRCTTPFYVQLVPNATGYEWTWPARIDSWLFNMPNNLMSYRPKWGVDEIAEKYSSSDRVKLDHVALFQNPENSQVDPFYQFDTCSK
jgi:hypothetical protein